MRLLHTCQGSHHGIRQPLVGARDVASLDYFADDLPLLVRAKEEEGAGFCRLLQHSQGEALARSLPPPPWQVGH